MNMKFSGTSLEECIEKASAELTISKESLKYRVTKEEKRFFKRKVEIEILNDNKNTEEEFKEKEIIGEKQKIEEKQVFGAKVEDGKIIITESENNDEIITIKSCPGVNLFVNGEKSDLTTIVTCKDKIEYKFEQIQPMRNIDISITNDKMEAYININSISKHIYELVDQEYHKNLTLIKKKIGDEYPPKYDLMELKELLKSKGIRYGIIEDELNNICNEHNVNNKLIAKGLPVQNDIPDEIKTLFKDAEELIKHEDSEQKVDYRNRYSISNANIGDIIGEVTPGKVGSDGIDVLGMPIKRKTTKKVTLKTGEGCKFENNKIIATTKGKPALSGGKFTVNKLYKVDEVDLKSGNIDFVGNVEVVGAVSEGMEVNAGNELYVGKNVESAVVKALGEVTIKGNVLNSTITAGSENVERRQYIDNLIIFKNIINDLGSTVEQINENNLLGIKQYGEIIKILIENKFKLIPKLSRSILNYNMSQGVQHSDITTFIINKLLGLGPLKIKKSREVEEFKEILEEEIEEMEALVIIPINIYLAYAQGADIESSGSVFITGKGQYTSNITALNNIEFTADNSVCRGGTLCAGSEIKLKAVGSVAGVNTVLKVPKTGRITADIAYNNTIFCFGEKQIMLEESVKNVQAYLDKSGQIAIDKFNL
ncbi:DUF342 domain-containing protein [Clostridium beijerinckii]|nr:DUF342 domain-containing protein [Clostridium beijerinckii]